MAELLWAKKEIHLIVMIATDDKVFWIWIWTFIYLVGFTPRTEFTLIPRQSSLMLRKSSFYLVFLKTQNSFWFWVSFVVSPFLSLSVFSLCLDEVPPRCMTKFTQSVACPDATASSTWRRRKKEKKGRKKKERKKRGGGGGGRKKNKNPDSIKWLSWHG